MKWLHNTQRRLCIKAIMLLYFSADYTSIRFIRVNTRLYSDTFRIIPYPTKLTIDWSHWGLYNWLQGLLSSLKIDSPSASQEIPWMLLYVKVHCYVHEIPLPVLVLSQMNPHHTQSSCFHKLHFDIVLPSLPRYSKLSPSSFCTKTSYVYFISLIHAT